MKILSHGLPFFCDYSTLRNYKGAHDIRSLGAQPGADYRFRPEVDTIEDILRRIGPEFAPELILVWTPENDPPPLGIERSPVRTACLAGDWNLFYNAQEFNLGRYDVVLSDKPGVEILRNDYCDPTYFFPLYAQNSSLHRPHEVSRDIDILYVGNLGLSHKFERGHWLQRLANLSSQYRVVLTTNVWGDEYARLHSRAKIVFNHSVRGELNLRVFETMACGALAFFEEANAEVAQFFTDGDDIVLYNADNFHEKVQYYLGNDAEREAIALRGQERVRAFAGEARLDALVDYILAQPDSGRPFLRLPENERDFQDYLLFCVSQRNEYDAADKRLAARLLERYPDDSRAHAAFGRSLLYYRNRPPEAVHVTGSLDAFKRAVRLAPQSAVHALNGATGARIAGFPQLEEPFLQLAIKATEPEPAGYLWGNWVSPHWTRWLRATAEKRVSVASIHAEAYIRLAHLVHKRGEDEIALAHLRRARSLDAFNSDGTELLGELLWKAGRREEAVRILLEDLPNFPLNNPYRAALAQKCIELGYLARADVLLREAKATATAVRYPWQAEEGPRSHAATREHSQESLREVQEARLRKWAADSGSYRHLIAFLAILGCREDLRALESRVAAEHDRLALRLYLEEAVPLEDIARVQDPTLFFAYTKACLKQENLPGALKAVETALEATPAELGPLNLLIRFLSTAPEHGVLLGELIDRSLRLAPQQQDIAALRFQPHDRPLYLEPAPRLVPVSFYLPAYNVEAFIGETLDHVLLQSYPLHECLVVNDGSRDASVDIARGFPVTILHHDENRGLAAARNTALIEASGEWLASVDTDARPEMDFLQIMMEELEQCGSAVAAIGGMLLEQYQEAPADRWRAKMMAQHHGPLRQQPPPFLFGSTMAIHRESAISAGGYDEAHRTNGEDTELCKALVRASKAYVYSPRPRAHHLRQDDLHSVLRTWWGWYYWVKMEAEAYMSVTGLVNALTHSLATASTRLNQFLQEDERRLWYLTFLLPFYDAFADFAQATRTGLLDPGEARQMTQLLLDRIEVLDARHGGDLLEKILRDTAPVRANLESCEAGTLGVLFSEEFQRYLTGLDIMIESIPRELYEALQAS